MDTCGESEAQIMRLRSYIQVCGVRLNELVYIYTTGWDTNARFKDRQGVQG